MAGPETISFIRTECYSAGLADQVQTMREERCFTDFTIRTNDKSFPCHRLIISAHSPVVKATLTNDMSEAAQRSVSYDHINAKVMKVILDYMYLGQIFFHVGLLMDVLTACDYLQMNALMQMCVDEVPLILAPANVMSWLNLATQLNLTALKKTCTEMMMQKFAEISQLPDFLAMSYAELQHYISIVLKSDTERDEMLQGVMRWVNHDTDQRLIHLENLLKQIQVENCSRPGILDVMKRFETLLLACQADVVNRLTTAVEPSSAQGKKSKSQGTLLIIGGKIIREGVSRVCWRLNPAKQFVKLCDIPFEDLKSHHSVCKTAEGFAITGGEGSDLAILYNAATRSWTKLKNMLAERKQHGSICIRGVLMVFGDYSSSSGKSVDSLVIEGGSDWHHQTDLPIPVCDPKVAEISGTVYVLDYQTKQLLQLDLEKKVWQRLASIPVKSDCYSASMIAINGQLCVVGGNSRICARYNTVTDTWSTCRPPRCSHFFGPLCYYDNALLLFGGKSDQWETDEIEEYDIKDKAWYGSRIKMPASLYRHHALVLDLPQEDLVWV